MDLGLQGKVGDCDGFQRRHRICARYALAREGLRVVLYVLVRSKKSNTPPDMQH
jgi:hypothetical protein